MRMRLKSIGVPDDEVESFTGHSLKSGGALLLRELGVRDVTIMQWFEMNVVGAYLLYTELCNSMSHESLFHSALQRSRPHTFEPWRRSRHSWMKTAT